MNKEIQDKIFSSIDIIIEKRLKELQYDKTIICKVIDKKPCRIYNDKTTVLEYNYKVQYQDLTFDAYNGTHKDFKVNDIVYVLIPQNDFTKKKIIVYGANLFNNN